MSSAQDVTQYTISAGFNQTTGGGTEISGQIAIYINAGSDFSDAEASTLQAALVAAFPSGWSVSPSDVWVNKSEQATTTYTTDYNSTPPSFS